MNSVTPNILETLFERVIILDWDDTLLSSSVLKRKYEEIQSGRGRFVTAEENIQFQSYMRGELKELERQVTSFVIACKKIGKVVIVTNGKENWVETSCMVYMPDLVKHLVNVPVISAQHYYGNSSPNPMVWKFEAFKKILSDLKPKHVLVVGDSELVEMTAIRFVSKLAEMEKIRVTEVKLHDNPTVVQLERQLHIITECLPDIVATEGSQALVIKIEQISTEAPMTD
jgi:predicted HAD superfamily phosphohydrolase YqeG